MRLVTSTARTDRADRDRHRHHVERVLAGLGPSADAARWRAALSELGPIFCDFGRYLSGRTDLLPEERRRLLASCRCDRPPLDPAASVALVERALKEPIDRLYAGFEPRPFVADGIEQTHRARLEDGTEVVVALVDPRCERDAARDAALLPLLARPLGLPELRRLESVSEEYLAASGRARDLAARAELLEALARHRPLGGPRTKVPHVVASRCARTVLTLTAPAGVPLTAIAPAGGRGDAGGRGEELAVRVGRAWLQQALFGPAFPVAFTAADVIVAADGRIGWLRGSFERLESRAQTALWTYLRCVAGQDPDAASAALASELSGGPSDGGVELRQRLRQAIPLREGGWEEVDDLAGELFAHARVVESLGYRPSEALLGWWRGLAHLAAVTRPRQAGRDALAEAVESARLVDGLSQLVGSADPDQMKAMAASVVGSLLTLPQKLDQVMSTAADGRANLRLEMVEPPEVRRRKDATAAALAGLLSIGALALLAHRVAALLPPPWGERIAAVALVVVGGLLLTRMAR